MSIAPTPNTIHPATSPLPLPLPFKHLNPHRDTPPRQPLLHLPRTHPPNQLARPQPRRRLRRRAHRKRAAQLRQPVPAAQQRAAALRLEPDGVQRARPARVHDEHDGRQHGREAPPVQRGPVGGGQAAAVVVDDGVRVAGAVVTVADVAAAGAEGHGEGGADVLAVDDEVDRVGACARVSEREEGGGGGGRDGQLCVGGSEEAVFLPAVYVSLLKYEPGGMLVMRVRMRVGGGACSWMSRTGPSGRIRRLCRLRPWRARWPVHGRCASRRCCCLWFVSC